MYSHCHHSLPKGSQKTSLAVTTEQGRLPSFGLAGFVAFDHFLNGALHVEELLRNMVVVTVQNALETADGVFQRHVLTRGASEDLGHVERLRQEALNFTCACNDLLIFVRQLVHTQDGD